MCIIAARRVGPSQFDRVVVFRKAGKPIAAELIDYKTDQVSTGAGTLDDRADHYRPQVEAYRQALAALTGLEASAIRARLAFTETDTILEID